MDQHGPSKNLLWILDDPERTRAKQSAMLDIDIKHTDQWIAIMRELVAEELPDDEFTVKRMAALKVWERGRKRAQVALHYAYDPRRRNPELVKREMKRQLAKTKAQIEAHDARKVPPEDLDALPDAIAPAAVTRAAGFHRDLADVHPATIAMIQNDIGLNPHTATDAEIVEGYVSILRLTPEDAQGYVDVLKPLD
jgi:hypothetical protein